MHQEANPVIGATNRMLRVVMEADMEGCHRHQSKQDLMTTLNETPTGTEKAMVGAINATGRRIWEVNT